MESRSLCGCATAMGPVVCMQPDRASAVMIAVIGNRNARATRTGAIPQSETAPVLHRLWLTNRFFGLTTQAGEVRKRGKRSGRDIRTDRARHASAAQHAISARIL